MKSQFSKERSHGACLVLHTIHVPDIVNSIGIVLYNKNRRKSFDTPTTRKRGDKIQTNKEDYIKKKYT